MGGLPFVPFHRTPPNWKESEIPHQRHSRRRGFVSILPIDGFRHTEIQIEPFAYRVGEAEPAARALGSGELVVVVKDHLAMRVVGEDVGPPVETTASIEMSPEQPDSQSWEQLVSNRECYIAPVGTDSEHTLDECIGISRVDVGVGRIEHCAKVGAKARLLKVSPY